LSISKAYCAPGILLLSLDRAATQSDELLCVFEESSISHSPSTSSILSGLSELDRERERERARDDHEKERERSPLSLTEGVSLSLSPIASGGKVLDIKEDALSMMSSVHATFQRLTRFSKSPKSLSWNSHHTINNEHALTVNASTLSIANAMTTTLSMGTESDSVENIAQLSPLSLQHLLPQAQNNERTILVLTSTGLHSYSLLSPAIILSRLLHTVDSQSVSLTDKFFQCYGPLQTSAMCVGIACGVPSTQQSMYPTSILNDHAGSNSLASTSENLQYRAMQTVLTGTAGPSFKADILASSTMSLPLTDSRTFGNVVPQDFVPSVAHDAIALFLSRLLRPIWHRPVFVGLGTSTISMSSVWTVDVVDTMKESLQRLQKLLLNFFSPAILAESTTPQSSTVPVNGRRTINGTLDFLTAQAALSSTRAGHRSSSLSVERELALCARHREDASLKSLYLLLSRSLHALSLIELLLSAQFEWSKVSPAVTVTLMQAMTQTMRSCLNWSFRSLILSTTAHDCLKRLCHHLLQSLLSLRERDLLQRKDSNLEQETLIDSESSDLADRASSWLAEKCYHFFSEGDKHMVAARALLRDIRRQREQHEERLHDGVVSGVVGMSCSQSLSLFSSSSPILLEKANACVSMIHRASVGWLSLDNVKGVHGELSEICEVLIKELGEIGRNGTVDICLATANNFVVRLLYLCFLVIISYW
jgi:hypothetical protein